MTVKEKKEFLTKLKAAGCGICGFLGVPAQFDFHHRYPELKSYEVGTCPPGQVETEVEKCILLCANCHRVMHIAIPAD